MEAPGGYISDLRISSLTLVCEGGIGKLDVRLKLARNPMYGAR